MTCSIGVRRWFLSYNSQDLTLMQPFEAALRRKDDEAHVFLATKSLRAGDYWLPELRWCVIKLKPGIEPIKALVAAHNVALVIRFWEISANMSKLLRAFKKALFPPLSFFLGC